MRPPAPPRSAEASDLQGWSRLAFDATLGLTGVVEAMHRGVTRLPGLGPGLAPDRTRGLTGLVYRSIRGVTRLAGLGVDLALSRVGEAGAPGGARAEQREALLAALNGVVGDHLAATDNPLAIPMRLRRDGRPLELVRQALAAALPGAGGRPLLLVHGSCLDDLSFRRGGHDLGAALARDLGLTPVSLRYNTGLHVSTNGRALADLLEALLREWPVPVERLTIVAHSMGGLLARSACHYAAAAGQGWLGRLGDAVFLGTPHHGTPLADLLALRPIRTARSMLARFGLTVDALDWLMTWHWSEFNRQLPDVPGVRYACVVGATTDRARVHPLLRPTHAYHTHAVGASDGVVPGRSQVWGETLAEVELDHFAQVGWSGGHDAAAMVMSALSHLRAAPVTRALQASDAAAMNPMRARSSPPAA